MRERYGERQRAEKEMDREKTRKQEEQRGKERGSGSRQSERQREREVMATNAGTTAPHMTDRLCKQQWRSVTLIGCNNRSLLSAWPLECHSSYAGPQLPPNLHNHPETTPKSS